MLLTYFYLMVKTLVLINKIIFILVSACTVLRDANRGIAIHDKFSSSLNDQHVHLQNALIDFYGKINRINVAEKIFNQMNLRETSTFNSLMKAYLMNNMPLKVLELFEQMKKYDLNTIGPIGFKPDLITFMAVCDACEKLGLLDSPDSSYGEYDWKKIFSTTIK
jgi:pentatricopeptide repeat protein